MIFSFRHNSIDQGVFLKLLEGIGAIKGADKRRSNYQDSVIAPLCREFDDDAVGLEDQPEESIEDLDKSSDDRAGNHHEVLSAIEKVEHSGFFIQFNTYSIPVAAQNCPRCPF